MALAALIDQFKSFAGGFGLIIGQELGQLAKAVMSAQGGIVAKAGGGQTLATPLTATYNRVDTCVTNADSVKLPLAIPGAYCVVENNTGQTLQVFGQSSNPNTSASAPGDTIAVQGSLTQVATGTGVTQATGVITAYVCSVVGQWKQGALT